MNYAITIVTALGLTGCTMGGGTTTVGIWRAKRQVDTEVCIQSKPDTCDREVTVARESPERSFGGFVVSWLNIGYARLMDDRGRSAFAFNNYLEYLRGRGGLGLGLRAGFNFMVTDVGGSAENADDAEDDEAGPGMISVPVSLVGHLGWDRVSFYAGGGYTYADGAYGVDGMLVEDSAMHGLNVLGGTRIVLRRGSFVQLSLNVDLSYQHFSAVDTISATTSLGLHL